jgi:hypothetical protein
VTLPPRVPRVYLAGPMRGIPHFNAPAFDQAAADLRELGYEVCNPLDRDRRYHGRHVTDSATGDVDEAARTTGFNLRDALAWDMTWIAQQADAIAVLPGWENSRGARAEVALAHALGIDVAPVDAFDAAYHGAPYATVPLDRLILPPAPPSSVQRADAHDVDTDREAGDLWRANPHIAAGVLDAAALAEELKVGLPPGVDGRPLAVDGEVRVTADTGGQKGTKPERFDLLQPEVLALDAILLGRGADKYDDHNYRKGYPWSLSFAALMRHAWAFWNGEDRDPEMGVPHMTCVRFHAGALVEFLEHPDRYARFDDRYRPTT